MEANGRSSYAQIVETVKRDLRFIDLRQSNEAGRKPVELVFDVF